MDNEIIQIFFDPATENIDWEKRKPRNGQQFTKTTNVINLSRPIAKICA